jgi:hypothetical protein
MKELNLMFKRIALLIVAVLMMMVVAEGAQAQGGTDPFWQASYWDNRYLAGSPVLQRREYSINYNWGDDEPPGLDIDDDTFSARWVGFFSFTPATYRFTTVSDDGVRLWVDGELIIDAWNDHSLQTITADKELSAGQHQIVVEYYENEGGAVIQFWWAPALPPPPEFPPSVSRPPGSEACLIYPRQNGGFVDPNLNPAVIQRCQQLIGEDEG